MIREDKSNYFLVYCLDKFDGEFSTLAEARAYIAKMIHGSSGGLHSIDFRIEGSCLFEVE